jgi:hypothetical protein
MPNAEKCVAVVPVEDAMHQSELPHLPWTTRNWPRDTLLGSQEFKHAEQNMLPGTLGLLLTGKNNATDREAENERSHLQKPILRGLA